jgi:hypothetical protein
MHMLVTERSANTAPLIIACEATPGYFTWWTAFLNIFRRAGTAACLYGSATCQDLLRTMHLAAFETRTLASQTQNERIPLCSAYIGRLWARG